MIIRGLDNINAYLYDQKRKNFEAWGERDGLGPIGPVDYYDRERDYADEDYPGPGLEGLFWDIPNM